MPIKKHPAKQCLIYGKTCAKCHRPNHFTSMCYSKPKGVLEIDLLTNTYFSMEKCGDIQLDTRDNTTTIKFKLGTTIQVSIRPTNIHQCTFYTNPLQTTSIQLKS